MSTGSKHRRLALVAALLIASHAVGHADDPKAKHWEPPFVGPAWRLAIEGAEGGVAESFASQGVQLLSWFPVTAIHPAATSGNDCWGYVSPSGREYALIGVSNGTGIVEITNPEAAQLVAFLPGPTSLWRNIKTYQHYMYAVSEGGGGIQVFDLSQIDQGIVTTLPSVTTGGTQATHTMIINEATGYLYRMGGGSNGLRIYRLFPNPAQPVYVGAWSDRYVHDGCVVSYTSGPYAGKEIFFACGGFNGGHVNTAVSIIDVTNKSSMQVLSTFYYPQAAYCHQIWPSADLQYAYINDEIDEQNHGLFSVGRIVNISDLSNPTLAGTYSTGLQTVDHNEYVRDDRLYCSNYKSGLRIFDISNPTSPVQIAWFDTYPEDDSPGYAGLWSNYPFFPSGIVLGSDIQRGLFVWRVSDDGLRFSWPDGRPTQFAPAGGEWFRVAIEPTGDAQLDPASPRVTFWIGESSIELPLSQEDGNIWSAPTPAMPCGETVKFRVSAATLAGDPFSDPMAPATHLGSASLGEVTHLFDPCEDFSPLWVLGEANDTATTGHWVRVDPIGTAAQPEDDHTPDPGVMCYVTGQGTLGGSLGEADVDNGHTTLTTYPIDATGIPDPWIEYWRWYSNDKGANPGTNSMPVLLSNNNGLTWTQLELVTENANAWVRRAWRISDYMTPTSQMRLRFIASDYTGAIVEAAVDDLRLFSHVCVSPIPGDFNSDGIVDGNDLGTLLGAWGACPGCPEDLTGDGVVDGSDLGVLLGNWS